MFGKTVQLSTLAYSFFMRHPVKKRRNKANKSLKLLVAVIIDS